MVPQAQKTSTTSLTGFANGAAAGLIARKLQSPPTLRDHGYYPAGQYPWDFWERRALASGVPADLATLGRAVMREADQHGWCGRLQSRCGWHDDGRRMIALALRAPAKARVRWDWLMDTDGLRVDPTTFTWLGDDWWEWPARRRQWVKERRAAAAEVRS